MNSFYEYKDLIKKNQVLLIDLRSEAEYQRAHIPCALNYPLLNNKERELIGTTYKQLGKQEAVSLGLEIFSERSQEFFEKIFYATKSFTKPVLFYCWRGGLRSKLVSLWFKSLGLKNSVLPGGYKSYRKFVMSTLDEGLGEHSLIVLNGYTGVGKTHFLSFLKEKGFGVIDFEKIAHHKGSVFGGFAEKKSPIFQQQFENNLCHEYMEVKNYSSIVVEIEGAIGPVVLSKKIRNNIGSSPMLVLRRSLNDRIEHIKRIYCEDWDSAKEQEFFCSLKFLQKKLSKLDYQEISSEIKRRNFFRVIEILLKKHYDKAYSKSLQKHTIRTLKQFDLPQDYQHAVCFLQKHAG